MPNNARLLIWLDLLITNVKYYNIGYKSNFIDQFISTGVKVVMQLNDYNAHINSHNTHKRDLDKEGNESVMQSEKDSIFVQFFE